MSKCAHCSHLDTKYDPAFFRKNGFARCRGRDLEGVFVDVLLDMPCDLYEAASANVVELRRVEWKVAMKLKGEK